MQQSQPIHTSKIVAILLLGLLAACSQGTDLPTVKASDPTWQLVPDHLDFGALPR
jgi:hypothetical protein